MSKNNLEYITRVCHPSNGSTLLQYLLISSLKEIEHTFFFINDNYISQNIYKHFQNCYVSHAESSVYLIKILTLVWYSVLRFIQNIRWPFLKKADIFIADHTYLGWVLGWKNNYTLLSDGMAIYQYPFYKPPISILHNIIINLMFYPFPNKRYGQTDKCVKIIVTDIIPDASPLRKKELISIDYHDLWQKSSPEKKDMIIRLFDISKQDVETLQNCETILLTQGFSELKIMSEDEKIASFKRMIDYYGLKNFVIKTHPQEVTDYSRYFPDAKIIRSRVPIELLAVIGNQCTKVATMFSSGASAFGKTATIYWGGQRFFSKKYSIWGEQPPPANLKNVITE